MKFHDPWGGQSWSLSSRCRILPRKVLQLLSFVAKAILHHGKNLTQNWMACYGLPSRPSPPLPNLEHILGPTSAHQGCINRSILPSGMGARGEHGELQLRCAPVLGEPCSGSRRTVLQLRYAPVLQIFGLHVWSWKCLYLYAGSQGRILW